VRYSDVERYYCIDVDSPEIPYGGGGASDILDDLFPITFPYNPPSGKYKITTKEYLTDRANGDFDTKVFLQIIAPDGQIVEVNRYFGEVDGKWQELDKASFDKRVDMHRKREYMELCAK
jgi:major membrane immunogen (membrane-anchored lipoprotein)